MIRHSCPSCAADVLAVRSPEHPGQRVLIGHDRRGSAPAGHGPQPGVWCTEGTGTLVPDSTTDPSSAETSTLEPHN